MITKSYNPSQLETEMTKALKDLEKELTSKLSNNKLVESVIRLDRDNPDVLFRLVDEDGDKHEIVLKVIQRNDDEVNP